MTNSHQKLFLSSQTVLRLKALVQEFEQYISFKKTSDEMKLFCKGRKHFWTKVKPIALQCDQILRQFYFLKKKSFRASYIAIIIKSLREQIRPGLYTEKGETEGTIFSEKRQAYYLRKITNSQQKMLLS